MQSLEFYIQYKDKQPVVIRTHELIRSTGQWVQVIFVVGELMDAFRLKSALANTPLESLTLHLSVDGPALRPGLCLSEISSGLTDDTPLIIKSENDMQIDRNITPEEALRQLSFDISCSDGYKAIGSGHEYMDYLTLEDSILNIQIPCMNNVPDLLYSEEIQIAEKNLGIIMPVEKILQRKELIIFLIGVSGCGKTRTCYDFCRSQWCLYFDCFADQDIRLLIVKLKENVPAIKTEENQEEFETQSAHLVNCLLVSRFLILKVFQRGFPHLKPFEWLRIQKRLDAQDLFGDLFDNLSRFPRALVSSLYTKLKLQLKDIRCIFDESQYLLEHFEKDYRGSARKGAIDADGRIVNPRSLFSFFSRHVILLNLKSLWCGTHMRIRNIELFYSAVGGKPESLFVFTDFNYLEADHIFQLLSAWVKIDLSQNRAFFEEISIFLQGRPRFFTMFIYRLISASDIVSEFYKYRKMMTTGCESSMEKYSLYHMWRKKVFCQVGPIQHTREDPFSNLMVSELLIKLCVSSLFGDGSPTAFVPDLDLVSTSLVMVNYTPASPTDWYASMVEPIALSAGLNFLADNYQHHIMDHLASPLFSPLGPQYLSPQERGNRMELIIALRFMQGWWKEESLQEFLPAWFDSSAIEKPLGVKDLRFGRNQTDAFLNQLDDPNDQWLLFPPTAAGPDVRYSVFCCYIKTTWTKKSESTIHVLPEDCRKNLETMGSGNWYKSSVDTQSKVKEKCKDKRFIHMRFELPDTAPGMKDSFCSGSLTGTTDHVICVSLDSNFGRIFFGEHFVSQYKDFVNRTINKR